MSQQTRTYESINKNKAFSIFTIISLVEGILAILWIVGIPADPKNAVFLGFSAKRLILLGIFLAGIIVILSVWTAFTHRQQVKDSIVGLMNNERIAKIIGFLGFLLTLILLVPLSEWGKLEATIERVRPLLIWLVLLLLQWFMTAWFSSDHFIMDVKNWAHQKIINPRLGILLTLSALIAFYLLSTFLYPVNVNEDYWFETGVPILLWQILVCVLIGVLVNRFEVQIQTVLGKRTNLVFFLIIFIACAVLWSSIPHQPGSYENAPLPPNYEIYPDKDAAAYDLQAQSALLGFGFDNSNPLDRPFYPLFLAVAHLLAGQEFALVMWLQAFLFGIFPALVYLICAEFVSRGWGVAAALAIGLWGWNSIVANSAINTASPKQMMTDFFLAVILSLVLYITVLWLKGGPHELRYAFLAGGALGLAAYVRYSALVLLPIWIILAIIKHQKQIRKGLINGLMIFLSFLLFIMPWYARNITMGKGFTIPFSGKVLFVINERYGTQTIIPGDVSPNSQTEQDYSDDTYDNPGKDPVTGENDLTKPFYSWFAAHFTHNVMGSLLILPTSLEIAPFNTSLTIANQLWTPEWDGKLPAGRLTILILQFAILASGIISLFRKNKLITLMFLLMFVGINFTNALGRTSGGRYIVPVDWMVIPIYFAGIMFLVSDLRTSKESSREVVRAKTKDRSFWVVTILLVLLIGASPMIFEGALKAIHQDQRVDQSLEQVMQNLGSSLSKEQSDHVENALALENARLIDGIVYFPTHQRINQIDSVPLELLKVTEGNALVFYLMRDKRYQTVYFPFDQEIDLKNMDKVYLVGCKSSGSFIVSDLLIFREGIVSAYSSDDAMSVCGR